MDKRLGCGGQGAEELKTHPFFNGVDWVQVVYQHKMMMMMIMVVIVMIVMIIMVMIVMMVIVMMIMMIMMRLF